MLPTSVSKKLKPPQNKYIIQKLSIVIIKLFVHYSFDGWGKLTYLDKYMCEESEILFILFVVQKYLPHCCLIEAKPHREFTFMSNIEYCFFSYEI